MSYVITPKISDVINDREQHLQNDLIKAKALKKESDDTLEKVNAQLDQTKIDAKSIIEKAVFESQISSEKIIKDLNFKLNQKIEKSLKDNDKEKCIVLKDIFDDQLLGVMLSCVSPENYEANLEELKSLNVPFGFKINAFQHIPAGWKPDANNPKDQLGSRSDLNPKKFLRICKKFNKLDAKIIGGCCEITPAHIKQLKKMI